MAEEENYQGKVHEIRGDDDDDKKKRKTNPAENINFTTGIPTIAKKSTENK